MPKRRGRKRAWRGWRITLLLLMAGGLLVLWVVEAARQNGLLAVALLTLVVLSLAVWARRLLSRRRRARTLQELLALSPAQFEAEVAKLLRDLGYRDVKRVGGAGDLAADIVCRDRQGRSVVVQCKRYAPTSRVGSPAIQHFIGMQAVHHRAERGVFVTTSSFSGPAVDLAEQHGILLLDGAELSGLVAGGTRDRWIAPD